MREPLKDIYTCCSSVVQSSECWCGLFWLKNLLNLLSTVPSLPIPSRAARVQDVSSKSDIWPTACSAYSLKCIAGLPYITNVLQCTNINTPLNICAALYFAHHRRKDACCDGGVLFLRFWEVDHCIQSWICCFVFNPWVVTSEHHIALSLSLHYKKSCAMRNANLLVPISIVGVYNPPPFLPQTPDSPSYLHFFEGEL